MYRPAPQATESARSEAIRLALRELGYIDGTENIAIEFRHGAGEERSGHAKHLAELARLKVDILVVTGGEGWDPGGA